MSAKQNTVSDESGAMDIVKWGLVVLLVAAGVAGNMYYAEQSLLYRVLGLVAVGAFVFVAEGGDGVRRRSAQGDEGVFGQGDGRKLALGCRCRTGGGRRNRKSPA